MLSQPLQSKFTIRDGHEVIIETGRLARQADGSVTVRQGNCIILATVVATREPKEGQSFFPLSVDYQEKFASAGRIPGSFFKREARLNDYEILTSRLIDRALRPLFPEDYLCEVQVLVTLISSDPEIMPDALACLAASAALAVSDIPIQEIISEVRVAKVDGNYIVNPLRSELAKADFEFMIAATGKNIMMVEGEGKECQEEDLIKAIEVAHDAIKVQVKAQEELRTLKGITAKRDYAKPLHNEEVREKVNAFAKTKIYDIAKGALAKHDRTEKFAALRDELMEYLEKEFNVDDKQEEEIKKWAKTYYADLQYDVIRDMILNEKVRLDGRKLDEVRPLNMEVDVLPAYCLPSKECAKD